MKYVAHSVKIAGIVLGAVLAVLLIVSCGVQTADPTPSPDASASPSQEPTQAPSSTPTPAVTSAPIDTPTDTPTSTPTATPPDDTLTLPDSSVADSALALRALTLCTGHTKENQAKLFKDAGYTVIKQEHYDKSANDASHTSAYTVAKRVCNVNGEPRTVLCIVIRGTTDAEWRSNFDFSPSMDNQTVYAENFYLAASDVLDGVKPLIEQETDPILLVSGHSRGAACANLLGYLLNGLYDSHNIYVYTFATPNTYRGETPEYTTANIFNYINPADCVTMLPPASLGFYRLGTDLVLEGDPAEITRVTDGISSISLLAPDIASYYTVLHSVLHAGTASAGELYAMTAKDMMLLFADYLANANEESSVGLAALTQVSSESDFAPLAAVLSRLTANNSARLAVLLQQHMPQRYAQLIVSYTARS